MKTRQRTNGRNGQKDAIAILKQDHETVKSLLRQLEETTPRGVKSRQKLLEKIALEVQVHAAIEEEIFYPAFREKVENQEDEKLFLEAAEEHGLVHHELPELQDADPASALFSARAKVLKDLIEHHAEEEESELMPRAKELMTREELVELGRRLEERKAQLKENGGVPSRRRPERSAANLAGLR